MIDPKIAEELKAKHGADLHVLAHDGCEVIVKRPGRFEYRKFRKETLDERKKEDAPENFIRACCVYPEPADLSRMLEARPGLVDTFSGALIDLAGTSREADVSPL